MVEQEQWGAEGVPPLNRSHIIRYNSMQRGLHPIFVIRRITPYLLYFGIAKKVDASCTCSCFGHLREGKTLLFRCGIHTNTLTYTITNTHTHIHARTHTHSHTGGP